MKHGNGLLQAQVKAPGDKQHLMRIGNHLQDVIYVLNQTLPFGGVTPIESIHRHGNQEMEGKNDHTCYWLNCVFLKKKKKGYIIVPIPNA